MLLVSFDSEEGNSQNMELLTREIKNTFTLIEKKLKSINTADIKNENVVKQVVNY